MGYFCLEELDDPATLGKFGIRSNQDRQRLTVVKDGRGALHKIERAALRPMVRRPGDLEGRLYVDAAMTAPWHMLYLEDDREELERKRWRHTLEYIRYGETQDFPAKEGSRRAGGVPAERPQVKVRPIWFQVAKIDIGPGRVCWIKGRGDRHYAPTIAPRLLVPDNFLYSDPPQELHDARSFAAIANLSWTHLMAEIFGRRSGGDGVLHTYIRELAMLPFIDPRKLTPTQSDDLVGLFDILANRAALPVAEELRQPDRQAFDLWAMRYLFPESADAAARSVERALRDLTAERTQRAVSGREQVRKAVRRTSFDPTPIAARALVEVGVPPRPAEHFGELVRGGLGSIEVIVPQHIEGVPEVGSTLFDLGDVLIDGVTLLSAPSESHAQLVVAHLMVDIRFTGELWLPAAPKAADESYRRWLDDWKQWRLQVAKFLRNVLPRPQQSERRLQVAREVEQQAQMAKGVLDVSSLS
ncbi:hypothetical protein [Krasilnikovia cinnamomea]|uniref:hypothetical protein n=1 Tax=Krasilnikovia cinnamomea TaxID=349313 RepID=UPI00102AC2C4|nr:hypothetical protein [Krasilnikovia cinnamomea]